MRKFLMFVCAVTMAVGMIIPAFAGPDGTNVQTYVSVDSAASGAFNVNTTTITPGKCRIIGYTVAPYLSGAGTVTAALYDSASITNLTTGTTTTLFSESAAANTASVETVFPYPKALSTGLSIVQGGGSVVTVYYVREQK
jgi:hypothetical protein